MCVWWLLEFSWWHCHYPLITFPLLHLPNWSPMISLLRHPVSPLTPRYQFPNKIGRGLFEVYWTMATLKHAACVVVVAAAAVVAALPGAAVAAVAVAAVAAVAVVAVVAAVAAAAVAAVAVDDLLLLLVVVFWVFVFPISIHFWQK